MIENLPNEIAISQLKKFDFGNIEAGIDELLFNSFCETPAIDDFLNGKKNLVIGEKGTGKTAIFRLIAEGKLKFNPKNGFNNLIVPIEDNFSYKNIKSKLLKIIDSEEENFKYQVIWEIFIFHKILKRIEQLDVSLPLSIKTAIKTSQKVFNDKNLDEFITSKKTFGIKLNETPTSIMPDVYFKTEPQVEDRKVDDSLEKLEIDLDYYKLEVNNFLQNNKYNIVILIDRLDEFVSKSEQSTQLEMLESLISVEREYSKFSNIDLKIFLRDDLFKRLSFDGIGYDKVISKKIDLLWTPDKIREFIAKRIIYNFINIFKIDHVSVNIDDESLEIDTSTENQDYKRPDYITRQYRRVLKFLNSTHYNQKFPRKTSLNDSISKDIILSILPRYVDYHTEDGKIIDVDVFEYFSNNFNLGTGNTIPRLVLIFLEKLFSVIAKYYSDNFDYEYIPLNEKRCFEVVKNGFFREAYLDFKKDILISYSKLNPEFEQKIILFKEKIGNRFSFRAKELKGLVGIKTDSELFHFCNYLLHIGFLKRTNSTTIIGDMKFELPLIFRNTK